jgi:hypothetical protein
VLAFIPCDVVLMQDVQDSLNTAQDIKKKGEEKDK